MERSFRMLRALLPASTYGPSDRTPVRRGTASTTLMPSSHTQASASRKAATGGSITTSLSPKLARTAKSFFAGAEPVPSTRARSSLAALCIRAVSAPCVISSARRTQSPIKACSSCRICLRLASPRTSRRSSTMDLRRASRCEEEVRVLLPPSAGPCSAARLTLLTNSSSARVSASCRDSSSCCTPETSVPKASCWSATNRAKSWAPSLGKRSILTEHSVSPTMLRACVTAPTKLGLAKKQRRASCCRRRV
mmetsp:Transcript_60420/g.155740  ORF Transcript_60420/g.155740 Transcript_60420/m.155740 type:complete len:251 (-) Transcript_60420:806-1558(-)